MKDEMMMWGVTLGKRYTNKEKSTFLQEAEKKLADENIDYSVYEKKSSIMDVRHLIVHCPEKAKVIIAVPYDTPENTLYSKYQWYPFSKSKKIKMDKICLLINTMIALLLWFASAALLLNMMHMNAVIRIIFAILSIMLVIEGFRFLKGRPNHINFSMNSAAVAVTMRLVSEFKNCIDVCFVFMDQSITSLEGSKILKGKVAANTPILYLGNLADGEEHFLVSGPKSDRIELDPTNELNLNHKKLSVAQMEQCFVGQYPRSLMLLYGDRDDTDFVIKNAKHRNDTSVDMELLERSEQVLRKFIERKISE
jgi:hypothetical protein